MVCAFTGNRDGEGSLPRASTSPPTARGQAAHLRRRHPLLPGGEHRARRAPGGARLPARADARTRAGRRARARLDQRHLRARPPADPLGRRLMHLGLCTFVTEYSIDPVRLGRLAEERGFDSLFFPEHTHIPVEPRHALSRRRRAAARVQPHARPVRGARRGGLRDRADRARHRDRAADRARPDHRPPRRWPRSTWSPAAACSSAWARAGTSRR